MSSTPKVEVRDEQPCIYIPIQVTFKEWGQANALMPQLFGWMAANSAQIAGPPFFRYRVVGDMNAMDSMFHLEIGIPVSSAVAGDDRVMAGSIPAGSYATLVHNGHPDKLFDVYPVLDDWLVEQNLTPAIQHDGTNAVWAGRYEFFHTDPTVEPDLNKWTTEVAYLLQG